ncbi:hypothetical protein HY250_04780 [Candidatus Azambacteria bacterium]|nr:hypothetical protein [Candidatus Azambacteria bacterium]MBI3685694.1 hypothetical protein [Candidatus Azambacteria bacterium]
MSATLPTRERVSIVKTEYLRLKKLDRRFRGFFAYFENLADIREARGEVKQKKIVPQEKLFKQFSF